MFFISSLEQDVVHWFCVFVRKADAYDLARQCAKEGRSALNPP